MVKYKIELAIKAKMDLKEIHEYITNNLKEPTVADRLLDKIEAKILTLKHMPLCHAVEQDEQLRHRKLRKLIVDNYLVFYIVNEKTKTVLIVRILYAHRDWANILQRK